MFQLFQVLRVKIRKCMQYFYYVFNLIQNIWNNLRQAYHNEVEPVPGVPQVGELGQHEAASHHLRRRLERVNGRE